MALRGEVREGLSPEASGYRVAGGQGASFEVPLTLRAGAGVHAGARSGVGIQNADHEGAGDVQAVQEGGGLWCLLGSRPSGPRSSRWPPAPEGKAPPEGKAQSFGFPGAQSQPGPGGAPLGGTSGGPRLCGGRLRARSLGFGLTAEAFLVPRGALLPPPARPLRGSFPGPGEGAGP